MKWVAGILLLLTIVITVFLWRTVFAPGDVIIGETDSSVVRWAKRIFLTPFLFAWCGGATCIFCGLLYITYRVFRYLVMGGEILP